MIRAATGFLLLTLPLLSDAAWAESSILSLMSDQQLVQAGHEAFLSRCSGCHGTSADGKGPAAVMLNPKPRNLVEGSFKFRTTPSGTLPTSQDLMRTLNEGVAGTAMPSFRDLPESEKRSLVAYIRSLRADFYETQKDQIPVPMPQPPKEIFSTKAGLLAAAKKGKVNFTRACVSCHGETGSGDGPAAPDLTDMDGLPIKPANLRLPNLKGGKTPLAVFRALTTGLDGSPMPGFESLFKEQERWELVAYVYFLRGREAGLYTDGDNIP